MFIYLILFKLLVEVEFLFYFEFLSIFKCFNSYQLNMFSLESLKTITKTEAILEILLPKNNTFLNLFVSIFLNICIALIFHDLTI